MTASRSGAAIGLVTLDFWRTMFADTQDSLRRAHAFRLEGVREMLAEAGGCTPPPSWPWRTSGPERHS